MFSSLHFGVICYAAALSSTDERRAAITQREAEAGWQEHSRDEVAGLAMALEASWSGLVPGVSSMGKAGDVAFLGRAADGASPLAS